MRWVIGLVPFALAASCGGILDFGTDAGVDAGVDAATTCATDSSCPSGTKCGYSTTAGCAAKKTCLPATGIGACKGKFFCACDGTSVSVCGGVSPKPVASPGLCDAGPIGCSSPLACEVCDVTGFSPVPQSKPLVAANACPSTDLAAFVVACFDPSATAASCQAWQQAENTANAACLGCLFTQVSAAAWGPLVCDTSQCSLDVGGCVDVALDQVAQEKSSGGPGSCGDLYSDEYGCVGFACGQCSSTSDASQCESSATANECKTYADATTATNGPCGGLDAGATPCFPQTPADYAAFFVRFCGQ